MTEELKLKICDYIEESLKSAKLQGFYDEDGSYYPLIDLLSPKDSIMDGEKEIENIVEQIYFDMENWKLNLNKKWLKYFTKTNGVDAIKIAILDGVLYIKGKNKMYRDITGFSEDYNIMSALVLREFLYQI